jgi:PKD repeat protein
MNGYGWQVSPGGTITSGISSETISVLWNTSGNQSVSINYTNQLGCTAASASAIDVTVHELPTPSISGASSACDGTSQQYVTQSGMSGYTWGLSSGGVITSELTTNIINVLWNTPGDHSLTINYTDLFGCTALQAASYPVVIHALPSPTITGATSVCVGSELNVYTTEPNMSSYTWAVSAGGSITSGGGTNDNTIEVSWNNSGSQWVSVNYYNTNNCSAATAVTNNLIVLALPTASIAYPSSSYCPEGIAEVTLTGQTGGIYTASPQGLSINSTTGQINLEASMAGTYQITYSFTDGSCSNSTQTALTIFALPTASISYSGSPYCNTGMANVTLNGQTAGTFASTSGLSLNQTTGEINLAESMAGTYIVTYTFTNGNCVNATNTTVSINPLPTPGISGETIVCEGSTSIQYSTELGMSAYSWDVSAGGSITSGLGTNAVLVNWNTPGNHYITVNYTSIEGCTASTASILNLFANPLPGNTGPIAGLTSVCAGSEGVTYTIDPVQNAIAYEWILPEGVIGTSNTNTIVVSFSNTALSGYIKVKALNNCAVSNESTLFVSLIPLPTADFSYSVPFNAIPTLFQDLSATANGVITNWLWSFGDGTTSDLQNPLHTYTSAGDYTVQLAIVTSLGCQNTLTKTVSVNAYIPFDAPFTYTDSIGLQVNSPVSVPIKVDNFTNVTAISLRLDYDPQVLLFNGFSNTNILLNDVMVYNTNINTTLSKIVISWSDIVPVSLTNGSKVVDLLFQYISGTTDLTWNNTSNLGQECEFADLNGVPMTDDPSATYYGNGNIHYRPDWQFDGTFVYKNNLSTPLDSLSVILIQNGVHIDTVLTNTLGGFNFPHVPNGIYRVNAFSNKPWQGVNSTDAAKIQRHFIGIEPLAEPVNILSGDVNNSQFVNATDALQVKRRFAGLSNYFARGNWTFSKALVGGDTITINGACLSQDFYGLCVGDVNGSNDLSTGDWNTQKVTLASEGVIEVAPGQLFEVPLRVVNNLQLSAISLVIPFPEDLFEPILVSLPSGEPIYNIVNSQIRIAWSELETLSLTSGEALLTIQFRAKEAFIGNLSYAFQASNESELADENGTALQQIELTSLTVIPYKATGLNDAAQLLYACSVYPNPARNLVNIALDLKNSSNVTCTLYNALGEISGSIKTQAFQKGKAQIQLNTETYPAGIYQLVIQLDAHDQNLRLVKKLVIE